MFEMQSERSVLQKLWSWLMTGHTFPSGSFGVYQSEQGGVLSTSRRVYKALMRHRIAVFVPLFYIVVGAIGVAVGVLLQWLLSVPWWIVPIACVVATWSYSFSSIWWKRRMRPISLRTELMTAINPQRGTELRRQDNIDRLMASRIPVFGVVGDTALTEVGGMSWDSTGLQQLSTRHSGDVEIQATDLAMPLENAGRRMAQDRLYDARDDRLREAAESPDEWLVQPREPCDAPEALDWVDTELDIDGHRWPAYEASLDEIAAVYAQVNGCWVTMHFPKSEPMPALRSLTATERVDIFKPGW